MILVGIHNTPITEDAARAHAATCTPCGKAMETLNMEDARRAFAILNNACLHAAGSNVYAGQKKQYVNNEEE